MSGIGKLLGGIGKAVGKVFKAVGSVVGGLFKNPLLGAALLGGAAYLAFAPAAAAGGAAAEAATAAGTTAAAGADIAATAAGEAATAGMGSGAAVGFEGAAAQLGSSPSMMTTLASGATGAGDISATTGLVGANTAADAIAAPTSMAESMGNVAGNYGFTAPETTQIAEQAGGIMTPQTTTMAQATPREGIMGAWDNVKGWWNGLSDIEKQMIAKGVGSMVDGMNQQKMAEAYAKYRDKVWRETSAQPNFRT